MKRAGKFKKMKNLEVSQEDKRDLVRDVMHRAATDKDFAAQRWQQEQGGTAADEARWAQEENDAAKKEKK